MLDKTLDKKVVSKRRGTMRSAGTGCWFLFRSMSIVRWCVRIPNARFSVFSLALCTLSWPGYNREAVAFQNTPPGRTQDQSATLPLDGAKIFRDHCAACHGV